LKLTSQLVEYCHSVHYDDIPPAAIDAAKVEILDSLGVGLAGRIADGVPELLQVVREWGGAGQSSVIGDTELLPAPHAAMVNAVMVHALDYDCGHTGAFVHTGVITVPAAFASAERAGGIPGREFLATAVVGTDLFCRLGMGLRSNVNKALAGWHWTSVLGFLSSAAIAARMFGLDEHEIRQTLGIAYHQCAGNTQGVSSGALTKRIGPGFAVRGGLTAALMAERGITGADDVLDGEYGLCKLYGGNESYDSDTFMSGLGQQFEGINTDIKIYPCGGMMDPFIDAALELVSHHQINIKDVQAVTVWHGEGASGFVKPLDVRRKPRNAVDTQFSIPWTVAVAIAKGRVSPESFTSTAIKDEDILAISQKITPKLDLNLNRVVGLEPGRVELHLRNGKTVTSQKDNHMSGTKGVLPFESVVEKFMDCAAFSSVSIPENRLQEVVDMVWNLDELDDATKIIRLLSNPQ
jgi:2-methylcitrate dehydratase PrpD